MSHVERQVDDLSEDVRAAGLYLVHLIAVGLRRARGGSDVPLPLPAGASWPQVHALARANSVEGASWFGAMACSDLPDGLRERWRSEADMTLWRRLQFDAERERVLGAVTAAGFSVLPLKGVQIAACYPDPAMRSMADNDILYGFVEEIPAGDAGPLREDERPAGTTGARRGDERPAGTTGDRGSGGRLTAARDGGVHGYRVVGATEAERARTVAAATSRLTRVMEGLGYRPSHVGRGNADCYEKPPCFNFEMHRVLAEPTLRFFDYYRNPWLRARRDAPGSPCFHFGDEDGYLYSVAHAFKHFDGSGCGIRCVVDEAVILDAKGASLDWGYIGRELGKLDMTGFEGELRRAAQVAFGGDPAAVFSADDAVLTFLSFLLGCGTYGNLDTRVAGKIEGYRRQGEGGIRARLHYGWQRLCPDRAAYASQHPWLAAHRVPRVLLVPLRAAKALTVRLPRTLRELGMVLKG